MEERDILVKTIIQKGTRIEPGNQKTIITGTIIKITKDQIIQGLVVSLNKDRLDRLKQKNSQKHQHHK